MSYADRIKALAPGFDPRHIQGFMLLAHSTLDGLSTQQFAAEVKISKACVEQGGFEAAERLAQSYGL